MAERVSKPPIRIQILNVIDDFRKINEFQRLKELPINSQTKLIWAEKALTWANILQHRAKLV